MNENKHDNKKLNMKAVWHIIDGKNDQEKARWKRVGTAFVNKDNSINVYLEAIPSDFKLHIRDFEPEKFNHDHH